MKKNRILSLLLAFCVLIAALPLTSLTVETYAVENGAGTAKNVIIMIGDGMGENHLQLAREQGYDLFMDTHYDLRGQSRTSSASHITTDSAAGGSALSCGVRIMNQTVGVYETDPFNLVSHPRSIMDEAISRGMRTGVVTTDKTTGATPASFSVHVLYRKQYEKIAAEQVKSQLTLLWGAAGDIVKEDAIANGWKYITTKDEMNALLPGTRSLGQFSSNMWRTPMRENDPSPSLAEMTAKAIELLNKKNGEGFVLMVEGAHIDKNSHTHDNGSDYPEKRASVANAVKGFDDAVRVAAEFARRDRNTVVVVTADHETGNIYKSGGEYKFHSHEHTAKNVPLFVYGCDDLINPGQAVDNYTIPRRLAKKLGWESSAFPKADPGILIEIFNKFRYMNSFAA